MIRLMRTKASSKKGYCFAWRSLGILGLALAMIIATAKDACAYIDPGSSSLMWQILMALLFSSIFYMKSIARRIRRWFRSNKNEE